MDRDIGVLGTDTPLGELAAEVILIYRIALARAELYPPARAIDQYEVGCVALAVDPGEDACSTAQGDGLLAREAACDDTMVRGLICEFI